MRDPGTIHHVAQACAIGGAAGIRAQGIADLAAIRPAVDRPLIGLWKDWTRGVVVTPTVGHAVAVARTGCEIVAVDGTVRFRPDDSSVADSIAARSTPQAHSRWRIARASPRLRLGPSHRYDARRLHGRHCQDRRAGPRSGRHLRPRTRPPDHRRRLHPHPNSGEIRSRRPAPTPSS
ncbi:hypothetical protein [Kribbella aluminosa]|uniref:hypothetical protein n=1 Tax=Kribbella aluminosa TaxID=416017 RepID=UPI0027DDA47D|nr:hypothetical protein [Kribbella aluminosa]